MLIPKTVLSNVIHAGLSEGASFCEIYAEENLSSLMKLKSSQTEYISGKDLGVGIRLFYGDEELYTYTNSLDEKSLLKALKSLVAGKKQRDFQKPLSKTPLTFPLTHEFPKEIKSDLNKEKNFLQKLDKELRGDSLISQCYITLNRIYKKVQIANSEGALTCDVRPYFSFHVQSIAEEGGRKEFGSKTVGQTGESLFLNEDLLKTTGRQSNKIALQNLKAEPAPAGKFPVIINKGFGGVIFHEACGHGMETTSVAKKMSVFSDKLGKKVASSCVTAFDDGTLQGQYGSIARDDEGRPSQKTCLIEKGILKNYMADRLGAQKTSYNVTGSARRQNYKFPPTSRMRNTYIDAGKSSLKEIIQDIDCGLFAETLGGGSVSPGTGNYNFSVTSARLIKKGRLDRSVKGASLVGNGLDTLSKISKVGKDLELAPGNCGSISGWVPVTVGQPPILVSELTVGGQKKGRD
ncbi:MAG: TldD/PmbA family protein [Bdellovibrionales bacterium]|nr:TldD/PmbA family protein [Bdellovibrionales bacterium]